MSESKKVYIGYNPPAKAMRIEKSPFTTSPGYDCIIYDAEFPEGTRVGDEVQTDSEGVRLLGVDCWLKFKTKKSMRIFGEKLIEFANRRA